MSDGWWKKDDKPNVHVGVPRAVAYYRHSAQDRQKNSIEIQSEQVRQWAQENNIEIIQEFSDRGKSGLTAEGRPAFTEMMGMVKDRDDFDFVLALDVSRWGRFQDLDLSAQYSAQCKQHGKKVIYTNLGITEDGSPAYPLFVQFERWRSAQYSRELSDKVFKGCAKIAKQGYRAGGTAPYGFHRVMVNEQDEPERIMNPGERKSIQNWRIKLTPDGGQHSSVVMDIFVAFVERQMNERQIAQQLNDRGVVSPGGRRWSADKVRRILQNETYIGSIVYNRTTQKLKSPTKANPRDDWIVTPESFQGLVPKDLFERARAIFENRNRRLDPDEMREQLEALYVKYGMVSAHLIRHDPDIPGIHSYSRQFGGIEGARQALFRQVKEEACRMVDEHLADLGASVEAYDDFLVIDGLFTVLIQPAVPLDNGHGPYWAFRCDPRSVVDITLGVPLSDVNDPTILGYFAMPRLLTPPGWLKLSTSNQGLINLHGTSGLHFVRDLVGSFHTEAADAG